MDSTETEWDDWGLSDKLFDRLEAEHFMKLAQRANPSSSQPLLINDKHSEELPSITISPHSSENLAAKIQDDKMLDGHENALEVSASLPAKQETLNQFVRDMDRLELDQLTLTPRTNELTLETKKDREGVLNFERERERGSIISIDSTELEWDDWGLSDKLFDSLEAEHFLKLAQQANPSSSSQPLLINDKHSEELPSITISPQSGGNLAAKIQDDKMLDGRENALEASASLPAKQETLNQFVRDMDRLELDPNPPNERTDP